MAITIVMTIAVTPTPAPTAAAVFPLETSLRSRDAI